MVTVGEMKEDLRKVLQDLGAFDDDLWCSIEWWVSEESKMERAVLEGGEVRKQ